MTDLKELLSNPEFSELDEKKLKRIIKKIYELEVEHAKTRIRTSTAIKNKIMCIIEDEVNKKWC